MTIRKTRFTLGDGYEARDPETEPAFEPGFERWGLSPPAGGRRRRGAPVLVPCAPGPSGIRQGLCSQRQERTKGFVEWRSPLKTRSRTP